MFIEIMTFVSVVWTAQCFTEPRSRWYNTEANFRACDITAVHVCMYQIEWPLLIITVNEERLSPKCVQKNLPTLLPPALTRWLLFHTNAAQGTSNVEHALYEVTIPYTLGY